MRSNRTLIPVFLALFSVTHTSAQGQDAVSTGSARLRIESFGPSRAYAVGQSSITLIASVRNIGDVPLPEGSVTGRLTAVSGLDYGEGDTLPKLPALAPNAVVTYRWRVDPTTSTGALVAAFALEYPNRPPEVRVAGIQHLASEPNEGVPSTTPIPVARVKDGRAVIENGRLRARVETTSSSLPGLWLTVRTSTGWKRTGVSLPLAEVLSGEGGQEPWWEVFRSEGIRAVNGVREASLILTGGIGIRWRATVSLTLRADSSILDYDIRLSPLRTMKISGLRLGTLHVGDGSFGSEVTEELPYSVNGANAVAAVRATDVTVGACWPVKPLFKDWQMQPLANVPSAEYQIVGAELSTTTEPVELKSGSMVDYHCRLYAITPSVDVRTAFNILVPPQRTVARPAPAITRALASRSLPPRLSSSRRALIMKREGTSRKTSARRSKTKSRASAKSSRHKSTRSAKRTSVSRHRSRGTTKAKSRSSKRTSAKHASSSRRRRR